MFLNIEDQQDRFIFKIYFIVLGTCFVMNTIIIQHWQAMIISTETTRHLETLA